MYKTTYARCNPLQILQSQGVNFYKRTLKSFNSSVVTDQVYSNTIFRKLKSENKAS